MKRVMAKLGSILAGMAARPLSVGLLLTIVFWIFLGNFVVAAFAGLLVSFFISAAFSVWKLNRKEKEGSLGSSTDSSTDTSDSLTDSSGSSSDSSI